MSSSCFRCNINVAVTSIVMQFIVDIVGLLPPLPVLRDNYYSVAEVGAMILKIEILGSQSL